MPPLQPSGVTARLLRAALASAVLFARPRGSALALELAWFPDAACASPPEAAGYEQAPIFAAMCLGATAYDPPGYPLDPVSDGYDPAIGSAEGFAGYAPPGGQNITSFALDACDDAQQTATVALWYERNIATTPDALGNIDYCE